MPDFRLQPSFPIASVIDAASRNAQLQAQSREAGNKALIEGLQSIGQVGQSLYDTKKRVAQSLALGKQFDIPDDVAKTMDPSQIMQVGAIKKGQVDMNMLINLLHPGAGGTAPSVTGLPPTPHTGTPAGSASPGLAASPPPRIEATLASTSPTIPMPAQGQPDSNIGLPPGLMQPTTGQTPVPIAAPPVKPQMVNAATAAMAYKMRDVPVQSQADALKVGHMQAGTKLINPSTATGQITWEGASPQQQALARAMYEGRVRPSDIGFRERGAMAALANEYGSLNGLPPYKAFNAEINATMGKYATSGKLGQNALSLNTALGHASSAYDSYKALGNTNQEWLNVPINKLRQKTNDPNVVALGINLNALRGELSNVFKNTGGTDQEIASWKEYLNEDLTPSQTIAAMTKVDELLRSRLDAMEFQKSQAGGSGAPLISPHAQKISKDLQNPAATQSGAWTSAQESRYQELLAKQKHVSQ